MTELRCEGCLSMASPPKVICSCNYAYYCSESCKESDWVQHRDTSHPWPYTYAIGDSYFASIVVIKIS